VADLQLLAKVFQLADDVPIPTSPFAIKGAKIAFCKTANWRKAGPGTGAAWEKAKAILKKQGAKVEEIELPEDFTKIKDWHANVLAGEGRTSFLGSMLQISEPSVFKYTCMFLLLTEYRLHPR
jgi:Asp-tRNA(Asn)/Glu-tRNA(Gln) amidotransferase A subunit family amidase